GNTFGGAGKTINIIGGNLGVSADAQLGNAANTLTFTNPFSRQLNLTSENISNKLNALQTGSTNFSNAWVGTFTPPTTGVYSFGFAQDDFASIYLDANNDSVINASDLIASAGCCVSTAGPTPSSLTAGVPYTIVIAYGAGGAPNTFNAKWLQGSTTA